MSTRPANLCPAETATIPVSASNASSKLYTPWLATISLVTANKAFMLTSIADYYTDDYDLNIAPTSFKKFSPTN